MAEGEHPTVAKVVTAGVFDGGPGGADDDFAFGLSLLLDSIGALMRQRQQVG